MFVRIRIRRNRCRLIPDHEAGRPEYQLEGDMVTVGSRFELWPFMTVRGAPAAVLYDARLLSIRANVLIVRGIEEAGAAAVLQEWDIPELRGRALGG